jgi:group I intron endonuclease
MIIYKITNRINNKVYIGQTIVKLSERINGHYADSKRDRKEKRKTKISLAITKYGFENFSFEIIAEASCQDELNEFEKKYIKLFKSNIDEFGYNLLSGGNQGGKHSEETKLKISNKLKENPPNFWLGKTHSIESNKKRSDAIKGKHCPQRGRIFTEEERINVSERMKKYRAENFWSTKKLNKETITSI